MAGNTINTENEDQINSGRQAYEEEYKYFPIGSYALSAIRLKYGEQMANLVITKAKDDASLNGNGSSDKVENFEIIANG